MNRSNLITGFDLGAMVEKTTEALYAGRSPPDDVLHGIDDNIQKLAQSQSSPDQPSQKEISSNDLSVIVDIEKPETWVIRSDVSAWRRIITNLLGNALKYTQSGFIKLSLSWVSKSLSPDHPDSTFAHFSITDTGCGISADFLKYKLFTPFSQENSFSTGVGLGLSIVQQIVTSLDGHIHVKSERGIGTEVDVFIPINDSNTLSRERPTDKSLDAISIHHDNLKSFLDSTVHIVGFNDYPDLGETPTGILSPQTTRKHLTQDFLNGIFSTWLGCTVLFPSSLNGASAGIAVMEEGSLKQLLVNGPPLHNLLEAASLKGIILLSLEAPRAFVDELANDRLVRVTQPYVGSCTVVHLEPPSPPLAILPWLLRCVCTATDLVKFSRHWKHSESNMTLRIRFIFQMSMPQQLEPITKAWIHFIAQRPPLRLGFRYCRQRAHITVQLILPHHLLYLHRNIK